MKLFGLLPKCLGKIFNGVSHFACNSRSRQIGGASAQVLRVAFARPAGSRGLVPRRGFLSGSPLSVA